MTDEKKQLTENELLREVVQRVNASGKRCWFCNGPVLAALAQVIHTSDCLISRIESTLTHAVEDHARSTLYAALLRECLWWMGMSLDNPPGLLLRIESALTVSTEDGE